MCDYTATQGVDEQTPLQKGIDLTCQSQSCEAEKTIRYTKF